MRECEQSGGYNMQSLNAIQLREMVETKYFGNVDMKFLEATADCFDPDATFTIHF